MFIIFTMEQYLQHMYFIVWVNQGYPFLRSPHFLTSRVYLLEVYKMSAIIRSIKLNSLTSGLVYVGPRSLSKRYFNVGIASGSFRGCTVPQCTGS